MSPIESIIYMIWRGIAIGVLISAPMGPVGILCIQRTLDKGKKAGFYTGIGAAISDLFYCLLTGFGLSFIEDFINDNQNVIQLVGSIVLIGFSIYLFRKNPSAGMRRPLPQNVSVKKNILGGFLFTFSNPLIIFLIIGLFARFNFLIPEIKGGYYAIGYVFIAIGALGWWYGITYVINKVRKKFNLRAMKIMNIIIGIVILGFACVGIVSSIIGLTATDAKAASTTPLLNDNSGLQTFSNTADTIMLLPLGKGTSIDFKLANYTSSPLKRYQYRDTNGKSHTVSRPPWYIYLISGNDTMRITSRIIEHPTTIDTSSPAAEFTLSAAGDYYNTSTLLSRRMVITDGMDFCNGWNSYRLKIADAYVSVAGGNRRLNTILTATIPYNASESEDYIDKAYSQCDSDPLSKQDVKVFIGLAPGASLGIRDITYTYTPSPADNLCCMPLHEIDRRLRATTDPLEGDWQILDINLDNKYILEGGDYRFKIIKSPDSSYEIVYIQGAKINASAWKPGMLKGRLIPSGLENIYDLIWFDPFGQPMSHHLKARETTEGLLLQFPYHNSTIMLGRK